MKNSELVLVGMLSEKLNERGGWQGNRRQVEDGVLILGKATGGRIQVAPCIEVRPHVRE